MNSIQTLKFFRNDINIQKLFQDFCLFYVFVFLTELYGAFCGFFCKQNTFHILPAADKWCLRFRYYLRNVSINASLNVSARTMDGIIMFDTLFVLGMFEEWNYTELNIDLSKEENLYVSEIDLTFTILSCQLCFRPYGNITITY